MTALSKPTVLVVDDESSIRESFSLILQDQYNILQAASGEAAAKKAVDSKIDLVFLDIRMPGIDGIETLRKIKEIDDSIEVVMVTAVNDIQKAAEAIRIGANNYIVKPFDIDQILLMTKALTGKKVLKHETKMIRNAAKSGTAHPEIPGISRYVSELLEKIGKLSASDSPAIIIGEPGSEAEDICRLIHLKSKRKDRPFKVFYVQKGASDDDMLEQLFGRGKGSFLNDLKKGSGLFEDADGGSVLFMNAQELSPGLMDHLAVLMQKKTFLMRGSSSPVHCDVRLMFFSSTNKSSSGEEDIITQKLFSVLKGSVLKITPLRERREDIGSIVKSCIEKLNSDLNRYFKDASTGTIEVLTGYEWPGNTMELKLCLKKVISSRDKETVWLSDLPFGLFSDGRALGALDEGKSVSFLELSSRFEKEIVRAVLKRSNFDVSKASMALNISKSALTSKLESLDIS